MDVDEGSGSSDSPVHEVEKDAVPAQRAGKKVSHGDNASAGSKREQVQNSSSTVSKKKCGELGLEAIDRLLEMNYRRRMIAEQPKDEDDRFSFEICMEKLFSLPDVSDEEICLATEALKCREDRIFFVMMRPSTIEYWLRRHLKGFRR